MSYKTNLELAYHMGYEDALARKMPDKDKVDVLLPDVSAGACEYVFGTDGHDGNWLTGEEIVRCRDCYYFFENATMHDEDCPHFCSAHGIDMAESDGFCSRGRRKEIDA